MTWESILNCCSQCICFSNNSVNEIDLYIENNYVRLNRTLEDLCKNSPLTKDQILYLSHNTSIELSNITNPSELSEIIRFLAYQSYASIAQSSNLSSDDYYTVLRSLTPSKSYSNDEISKFLTSSISKNDSNQITYLLDLTNKITSSNKNIKIISQNNSIKSWNAIEQFHHEEFKINNITNL